MTTPLPPDEVTPEAKTRRVIEALSDSTYRDLTLIAAVLFDAPIAAISILDGTTQWLRARRGLALDRTPRQEAFCNLTVLSTSGDLVVSDARQDGRFKDFPLVNGPTGIRFYAGAALVTADGETLGAICVMDTRPGQASSEQMIALAALARQVVALLELADSMEALERHLRERAWYEGRLRDSYRLLERRTENLTRQALSDPLTGAANRRAFDQELSRSLSDATSWQGRFTLALIDLDRFKPLNDLHGHPAGDVALRDICLALRRTLEDDILLFRVGGDEFALLIPGSRTDVSAVLERARQTIAVAGTPHGITASIGATACCDNDDADQMVVRADAALYLAKGQGGNQVVHGDDPACRSPND